MGQLIPGFAALVEAFRDVFHPRVFSTFQALIACHRFPRTTLPVRTSHEHDGTRFCVTTATDRLRTLLRPD